MLTRQFTRHLSRCTRTPPLTSEKRKLIVVRGIGYVARNGRGPSLKEKLYTEIHLEHEPQTWTHYEASEWR